MKIRFKPTRELPYYLTLLLFTLFFFFPFFSQPQTLLSRNNDLLEFRGVYTFLKTQIVEHHFLPLWQNRILSGSPFLGDPQNPLLYLPIYLVLVLDIDTFFLTLFFLHLLLGVWGTYYLARKFKLASLAALFPAAIYGFAPKFVAHLEAGHLNMLAAYAWFPLFLAALLVLSRRRSFTHIVLLAVAAATMFLNYVTIWLYATAAGIVFFCFATKKQRFKSAVLSVIIAIGIFLVLTLPQFLVFLRYLPLSTRGLMTLADLGPYIPSGRKFLVSIVSPYVYGFRLLETETVVYLGTISLLLAGLGFYFLNRRQKIICALGFALVTLLALGVKIHLYSLLTQFIPQLIYLRITTRVWFVTILGVALLSGMAVEKLSQKPLFKICLLFLIFAELGVFSRLYFRSKTDALFPPQPTTHLTQISTSAPGYYRLYCLTLCLPDISTSGKGIVDGYNPIQLRNYYDFFQIAAGYKFASYAVALPPYNTYASQPQPRSREMGILGVRYIVSAYRLQDPGFNLITQDRGYFAYQNRNEKPRVYLQSGETQTALSPTTDLPGQMIIPVAGKLGTLVISEVYTPFWVAKSEDGKPLSVSSYQNIVTAVTLDKPVNSVTLEFLPAWVRTLVWIALAASAIAFVLLLIRFCQILVRNIK